jgi:hypothetical protein
MVSDLYGISFFEKKGILALLLLQVVIHIATHRSAIGMINMVFIFSLMLLVVLE